MLLLCGAGGLSGGGKKNNNDASRCAVTTNYITSERSALINTRVHFTKESSNTDSWLLCAVFIPIKCIMVMQNIITTSLVDASHNPHSCLPIWRMEGEHKMANPAQPLPPPPHTTTHWRYNISYWQLLCWGKQLKHINTLLIQQDTTTGDICRTSERAAEQKQHLASFYNLKGSKTFRETVQNQTKQLNKILSSAKVMQDSPLHHRMQTTVHHIKWRLHH